ncbi:MAG: hypothetical protein HOP19_13385, partial [Acidobacteria bacterium]|nr:hypothetical protein [Acidobacteriota bacterium]
MLSLIGIMSQRDVLRGLLAAGMGPAAASASLQQGQRVTVQFQRVIYGMGFEDAKRPVECPPNSLQRETNATAITIPLSYECQGAKVTGQASLNFPAGPLSGTLDANGDLVLDAPATLSGKVDLTANSSAGFVAQPQTLALNLFCAPQVIDRQNIELTAKQWSVTSSCSLRKISRGLLFPNVFTHQRIDITFTGGGRIALFGGTDFADFAPITAPTPTPTPSNRVASITVQTEVVATNNCPVTITVKKDGVTDTSFNDLIKVSLTTDKPRLGCLRYENGPCAATLTVPAAGGVLNVRLQTPQQELTRASVLRAGETPLQGTATITAELGSVTAPAQTVKVKSPLDLKIDRIEVQQGYKPVFDSDRSGPYVRYRDLLIRVFLDANRLEFDKYASIRDLTAQLTVRNQSGNEIAGSPFTLSLGALAKGTDTPSEPYVFQTDAADAQGSDSLNHVLYVTQEQLNLSVKLNEVYADKDASNDEKTLPPLNFVASKPITVLYSPARLKTVTQSSNCPHEDSIAREINFTQLAYPVSFPESGGQLRFIQVPNPSKNEACEVLTSDPLPETRGGELWFWVNRTKRSDVKGWVYFVDTTYFQLLNQNNVGIANRIGGSVAIVSDPCLGPDTGSPCGILAHELGHLFGLGDTYTFASPLASPNNPPQGAAAGNEVGSGTFSWFHHRFSLSVTDFIDFMGASNNSWTDRVNWNYLRSQLLPATNSATEPEPNPLAATTAVESFVIVQGQVRKNGTAALANCYTLTGEGLASPSDNGSYVLETL